MKGAVGRLVCALSLLSIATLVLVWSGEGSDAATTYIDGDWDITEHTVIEDGTWVVNGSVNIHRGSLSIENATLDIASGSLERNAILVSASARLSANGSTIKGIGWGVHIDTYGVLEMWNTTLHDLDDFYRRAGIYQRGGTVALTDCRLDLGGIGIESNSTLTVRNCVMTNLDGYGISWEPDVGVTPAHELTVTGTRFGFSPVRGRGIYLRGPGPTDSDIRATIRGCTFDYLYLALYALNFEDHGSLVVEDNVAVNCSSLCCELDGAGDAITTSGNHWETDVGSYVMAVEMTGVRSPDINNETLVGGTYGLYVAGYGTRMRVRDSSVTGAMVGVYTYNGHIDLHGSRIRGRSVEFYVGGSGQIHLYDCDHTYKGEVQGYSGEVAEPVVINFTSVTWQDGTMIEEGRTVFENETGFRLAERDNVHPAPVPLPTWRLSMYYNITADTVRGVLEKDGLAFRSEPFSVAGPGHRALVIVDNSTPEVYIRAPADEKCFATNSLLVKGNLTERGVGLGTVRVRYGSSNWTNATLFPDNTWQLRLKDLPEGVWNFTANITDLAGNSREACATNITIDTVWPFIEVHSPPKYVRNSPVRLMARTEPRSRVYVNYEPVTVMPDGMFSSLVALYGLNNGVHIRVVDVVGHTNVTTYWVIYDTEPPALTVDSPSEGGWTSNESVVVTGTTEADATIVVNGYTGEVDFGRYSIEVPLAEGENVLAVTATDRAGNVARSTRTVRVDRTPPVLKVTDPPDGSSTVQGSVVVAGTVTDDGEVTVLVAGVVVSIFEGRWARELALDEGSNTFTVRTVDAAGHEVSATVRITRDSTPPKVEAWVVIGGVEHGPEAGTILTTETGIAIDVHSSESATLRVSGGSPIPLEPGRTTHNLLLVPGENEYVLNVTDALGNRADPIPFTVVHDSEPPDLQIISPRGTMFTGLSYVLVRGVTEPGAEVTVNGIPAPLLANGSFSVLVPLERGPNYIQVTATDPVGNFVSMTCQVVQREADEEELSTRGIMMVGGLAGLLAGLIVAALVSWAVARRRGPSQDTEDSEPSEPGPGVDGPYPPATPEEPMAGDDEWELM